MREEHSSPLAIGWRVWLFAATFTVATAFGDVPQAAQTNNQPVLSDKTSVASPEESDNADAAPSEQADKPIRVLVYHSEASLQAEGALRQSFNKTRSEFIEDLF